MGLFGWGEGCRCAQFPFGIEVECNEIGEDEIIQIVYEARVLLFCMPGEIVQVDAEFFCFNVADGEEAIGGDEIRSADVKLSWFMRERESGVSQAGCALF